MTEVNHPSNFSFRLFDLYRRFVEILQLHPNFLADFKTGAPKEEICRDIIKKTFIHRQTNEKIEQMIIYLKDNAKHMAYQTENKPNGWNAGIKYTNTCIKLIRNYLRRKGISNKTSLDLDSIHELAKDIGEAMYNNCTPNEKQIDEIKKYLEEDRLNPKKTIIPTGRPKKAKRNVKKAIDTSQKVENLNILRGAANLKISSPLSTELLPRTNEEEIFEELKAEVQDKSEDESLKTKSTLSSREEDLQDDVFIERDKLQDEEYIRHLFNKMKHNYTDEYVFIGIDETAESFEECEDRTEIATHNNESRNCLRLKRKSIVSIDDHNHDIKKSFLSKDVLKEKDDQYMNANYNSSLNNCVHMAELEKLEDDYDDSDTEINVVDDEDMCQSNLQAQNMINQQIRNQDLPIGVKNKLKKKEEKVMFQHNQLKSTEEKCLEDEGNYSNVANLTYDEVLRLTELVMAFCEVKNEISLEEFLVLRRIRDKMKLRSLKEFTKLKHD